MVKVSREIIFQSNYYQIIHIDLGKSNKWTIGELNEILLVKGIFNGKIFIIINITNKEVVKIHKTGYIFKHKKNVENLCTKISKVDVFLKKLTIFFGCSYMSPCNGWSSF